MDLPVTWYRLGILWACFTCGLGGGCALGNYGSLASKVTYTETAMIVETYMVGFQVRPDSFDGGATLGHRRSVFIFPCSLKGDLPEEPEWHWFYAPLPEKAPFTSIRSVYGLDLETSESQNRFTLGYSDKWETRGPRPGESMLARVFFDRRSPESAQILVKESLDGPTLQTCG